MGLKRLRLELVKSFLERGYCPELMKERGLAKPCFDCGKIGLELNSLDTCSDCEAWREFTWRNNWSD